MKSYSFNHAPSRKVLLGAASALALVVAAPAMAQQPNQAQQGQQSQQGSMAGQQSLQQPISALEKSIQKIEGASSGNVKQAATQAMGPLNQIEASLQQMGGDQGNAALDSVETARSAIQEPRPDKALIVQALEDVVEATERVHANSAKRQGDTTGGSQGEDRAQDSTQIGVEQRSPDITVQQKAPQVTVDQPRPNVTVEQPRPQVTVQQPKPEVTVEQQRPEVTVEQARPDVSVERQGQPQVTVQRQGEPQVSVERQGQADVTVQRQGQQDSQRSADQRSADAATDSDRTTTRNAAGDESTTRNTTAERGMGANTDTNTASNPVADMGERLVGQSLYGANNTEIGDIENVVMAGSEVEAVLVDVGGFLGIGERRVAIPVSQLAIEGDRIVSRMTEDQVSDLPEYQG